VARGGRIKDLRASPRTHETVLIDERETERERGRIVGFLPGDSMHLTPITLFIRGDKQFAEKKEDGADAGR